jgi:hypothetical protein
MSNEVGEPDGLPVGPLPGAIRFDADGRLEIYREDGWQPLVRVSDADLPPITRVIGPTGEAAASAADAARAEDSYRTEDTYRAEDNAREDNAAEDSGGNPGRQAPP